MSNKVKVTAHVSSSVHQETLEFVIAEGSEFDLAAVNALIAARECSRPGVDGDAAGSDYFSLSAPATEFEVLDIEPASTDSASDAASTPPRAPETGEQPITSSDTANPTVLQPAEPQAEGASPT